MNRPIVKYVVRVALFASTVAAIACSSTTAPTAVSANKASLKDSTDCSFGFTVINGVVSCNGG